MDEPRRASADARDEAQRGREAALLLLDAEEHPGPIEGFSQMFADAALDEIEHLQKTRFRGVVKRLLEGAVDASMSLPWPGVVDDPQTRCEGKAPGYRTALFVLAYAASDRGELVVLERSAAGDNDYGVLHRFRARLPAR